MCADESETISGFEFSANGKCGNHGLVASDEKFVSRFSIPMSSLKSKLGFTDYNCSAFQHKEMKNRTFVKTKRLWHKSTTTASLKTGAMIPKISRSSFFRIFIGSLCF